MTEKPMSKSSTTTTRGGLLQNPHPGEILLEEFLKPMGLSQNALARAVHVAPRRINEIVLGKRDVTADTDLPLARGMSGNATVDQRCYKNPCPSPVRSRQNRFPSCSATYFPTPTPSRDLPRANWSRAGPKSPARK